MKEKIVPKGQNAEKIIIALNKSYPGARTALDFSGAMELLVATVLSAQCTDERVNKVTAGIFKKYKTAKDYASADANIFSEEIRSLGLFRSKAKNIIAAAKIIDEKYRGRVPSTMDRLVALPGIARKTANIILHSAFKKNEGIAVDTHVRRLSRRIGLTKNEFPDKIERDLMAIIPKRYWGKTNTLLVVHGRSICTARKPKCGKCVIEKFCRYPDKEF